MKQVLIKQGNVLVEDVPAPAVQPGSILVRVARSSISPGTESASIASSSVSLWSRALQKPEKARAALGLLVRDGWGKFQTAAESRLQALPTGYSAAGVVHELGSDVQGFSIGDRVACAGAQCAYHAEWICVPTNLATRLPEQVSFDWGSTVALGAIALQGVRRAGPSLGEIFVVSGLGVIGQITVQILKANGCRVIAMDLNQERAQLAAKLGADFVIDPDENAASEVSRLTDGIGADGAIVTASSSSNSAIQSAFRVCRKKGRVILVGDVGLDLNRADLYEKELDFLISTSYGPGRYDDRYEMHGLDYPVGYVRWTENRNMAEYLRLCGEGKLRIEPLITHRCPVTDAAEAYQILGCNRSHLLAVLSFDGHSEAPDRKRINQSKGLSGSDRIRIALAGAGAFAKAVHLPNLKGLRQTFEIRAVVSRNGHNASQVANQFGAAYSTTEYESVLADSDIDAVIISTRHDLHAQMALSALMAGKHVLVEKPLALTQSQLERFSEFYGDTSDTSAPVLQTGFNRRHSVHAREIAKIVHERRDSMVINYTMNAGYLPTEHWVHGAEGGGRNRGEACHVYDLFTFLTQSRVLRTQAEALNPRRNFYSGRDNFTAIFSFDDGSIASLTYTSVGSNAYAKETMQVFVDGKVIVMDDYRRLSGYGIRIEEHPMRASDKGHVEELEAFAAAVRGKSGWPIALWEQVQATAMALQVEKHLQGDISSGIHEGENGTLGLPFEGRLS